MHGRRRRACPGGRGNGTRVQKFLEDRSRRIIGGKYAGECCCSVTEVVADCLDAATRCGLFSATFNWSRFGRSGAERTSEPRAKQVDLSPSRLSIGLPHPFSLLSSRLLSARIFAFWLIGVSTRGFRRALAFVRLHTGVGGVNYTRHIPTVAVASRTGYLTFFHRTAMPDNQPRFRR